MSVKALVLLSGGLDSVFNLYRAHEKWPGQVRALFFNYGQRAQASEWKAAEHFSEALKIPLQAVDISYIFKGDRGALTGQVEVPTTKVDIDNKEASVSSAAQVWVANRNGVFLNIAACLAEKNDIAIIVPGFNAEEAETFPDNSQEYIEKMNACLRLSTSNGVQIQCFSQEMNKSQIVADCMRLNVDLDRLWSCYFPGPSACGQCESCQRLQRARSLNSL